MQWQCQDVEKSQPRLPNLEGNITSVWNSQDRSLSREDLEQALESAGKVDAGYKSEKEVDRIVDNNTTVEIQSIPSAFIHENVKDDDDTVISSDIEIVPTVCSTGSRIAIFLEVSLSLFSFALIL